MKAIQLRTSWKTSVGLPLLAVLAGLIASCAKPVPPPNYTLNPHPQKYLVTLHSDQPLPPGIVVRVQYSLAYSDCIPPDYTRALFGVRLNYTQFFYPKLHYIDTQTVSTNVSGNKILPGNYWGRGVCHWDFVAVQFVFPGRYFVGLRGRVVQREGTTSQVCHPVSLKGLSKLCDIQFVYDKSGSVVVKGRPENPSRRHVHYSITARRLNQ